MIKGIHPSEAPLRGSLAAVASAMARSLFRRVGLRILPLLMLLTTAMGILNWNATIAALTMNVDLSTLFFFFFFFFWF